MVNFKNSVTFVSFLCLENCGLRNSVTSTLSADKAVFSNYSHSNSFSIVRTFGVSDSFNFIRFYYLLHFVFPYIKARAFSKKANSELSIRLLFQGNFFFRMLAKLYSLRFGAKSSFVNIHYNSNSGQIRIAEPHVVFLVSSPYFDYHDSRLSLSFNFFYDVNKPTMNFIFNYLF